MPTTPLLGIFSVAIDRAGGMRLLARTCPVYAAEPYGESLTFPPGYHETWRSGATARFRRPHRGCTPSSPPSSTTHGRVVLDTATGRFSVSADRQLLDAARVARMLSAFALPSTWTIIGTDPHRSRARRPPPGDTTT